MSNSRSTACKIPFGVLLYALFALILTYPLVFSPSSGAISHWTNDLEHSLWVQWWFASAMESPRLDLFHTDMIQFPNHVNLEFADINLAVCAAFYPLFKAMSLVTGHDVMASLFLTYNFTIWLSFTLAAGLMWRLAKRVCNSEGAAWAAGLLFAASPYWLCCVLNAWVYLIHIWTLPLVFLAILRARDTKRTVDFGLAGLCFGLIFHVSPYYFLFSCVLLVSILPWQIRRIASVAAEHRPSAVSLGAALCGVLIVVLPRVIPMLAASRAQYRVHHSPLNTVLGAEPSEMFLPSFADVAARVPSFGYLVVFLGYTLLGVILLGLVLSDRRSVYWKWLVTGSAMMLLSVGPFLNLSVGGTSFTVPLPDYLLHQLPGFAFMTNHWRWSLPGTFCFTIAFSIALADVSRFAEKRRASTGRWIIAVALSVFISESFLLFPFPVEKPTLKLRPTPIAHALKDEPAVKVVVGGEGKLDQMIHGKAIVGGWLPRLDTETRKRTERLWGEISRRRGSALINYLGQLGVSALVVNPHQAVIITADEARPGTFKGVALRVD